MANTGNKYSPQGHKNLYMDCHSVGAKLNRGFEGWRILDAVASPEFEPSVFQQLVPEALANVHESVSPHQTHGMLHLTLSPTPCRAGQRRSYICGEQLQIHPRRVSANFLDKQTAPLA
jgi:hypothetical protein